MKTYFLLFASLFSFLALADEPTPIQFTYTINSIPKTMGSCHELAQKLGDSFSKMAQVKLLDSYCQSTTAYGHNVTIRYESLKKINLVSTTGEELHILGTGLFASAAECNAVLDGETKHFEEATGLKPLVSYCYEQKYLSSNPWMIRIDSIGVPKLQPDIYETMLFGTLMKQTPADLLKTVTTVGTAKGIDMRLATFAEIIGYSHMTILYYAKERVPFASKDVAEYPSLYQCEENGAVLKDFMKKHPSDPIAVFCIDHTMIGGYQLQSIFMGMTDLQILTATEEYATYDLCMADQARLLEFYQKTLKRPTIGMICNVKNKVWRPELFEKRKP